MDKILDKDNFSKRLNRYFQITSQVGGIVTRIGANKYLGLNTDHKKNAHNLQEKFGQAKGPFMKIAQLLAMIPDAIPREYANQLMKLQTNAPPMGEYFVRRRMKNELGENWKKKFINFNETSSFAASFGQVHKAKLNNGQLVACKIQYPDMLSTVKADLVQLKVVLNLFEKFNKVIKTSKIHSEIKERLFEEIDYIKEAQNINIFNRIFKNETKINIPNIFSKYTTSKLITMSWLDGRSIHHLFTSSNNKLKEKVATNIFNAWYKPFYSFAIIHGDPHFGNYSFTKNGNINLFDFGCIRIFPVNFVKAVIDLYYALERKDIDLAVEAYKTWGFKKINKELIKILNLWASYIYGPLLENKRRFIQGDGKKGYGFAIANKVYKKLKQIGGVEPPKEFVFIDRAAIGMGSLFMKLNVRLNWYELFNNLIKDFELNHIKKKQEEILY